MIASALTARRLLSDSSIRRPMLNSTLQSCETISILAVFSAWVVTGCLDAASRRCRVSQWSTTRKGSRNFLAYLEDSSDDGGENGDFRIRALGNHLTECNVSGNPGIMKIVEVSKIMKMIVLHLPWPEPGPPEAGAPTWVLVSVGANSGLKEGLMVIKSNQKSECSAVRITISF